MTHVMVYPSYTPHEAQSRETFLGLMWALSYPGKVYTLTGIRRIFEAIADTLLDLETSFFTPDAALASALLRTGARARQPNVAAYHFYPAVNQADLIHLEQASPGSMLDPDRAATFILGCTPGTLGNPLAETTLVLRGPGIPDVNRVCVGGIPDVVWTKRESVSAYPTGWDLFVVDPAGKIIGLPRSTQIQVEKQEQQ